MVTFYSEQMQAFIYAGREPLDEATCVINPEDVSPTKPLQIKIKPGVGQNGGAANGGAQGRGVGVGSGADDKKLIQELKA